MPANGCYQAHLQTYRNPSAHPDDYQEMKCKQAGTDNNLKVLAVVNEKDLVHQLVETAYIKQILKKSNVKAAKIHTLADLTQATANYNNDEWQCVQNSLTTDLDSFAITGLNKDSSINLKIALTSDIHVCSSIFKVVEVNKLKPLIPISSLDVVKY